MQLLIARKINGMAFSSAPAALTHEVFLGSCHCQRASQEPCCCEQWGQPERTAATAQLLTTLLFWHQVEIPFLLPSFSTS